MYMHCYRTTLQIIPCNTSNGIEGINSQLKNVEGMKGGNIKLHQFCRKMNMDTFPEHKRKYELAQLSAADMDLGQRPDEKPYLINRPRRFMNDCRRMSLRNRKHEEKYGLTLVTQMSPTSYHVASGLKGSAPHLVEFNLPRCDCFVWRQRRYLCPHLIRLLDDGCIKWEDLPASYTSHNYFHLDTVEMRKAQALVTDSPISVDAEPEPDRPVRPETPVMGILDEEEYDPERDDERDDEDQRSVDENDMRTLITFESLKSVLGNTISNLYLEKFFRNTPEKLQKRAEFNEQAHKLFDFSDEIGEKEGRIVGPRRPGCPDKSGRPEVP